MPGTAPKTSASFTKINAFIVCLVLTTTLTSCTDLFGKKKPSTDVKTVVPEKFNVPVRTDELTAVWGPLTMVMDPETKRSLLPLAGQANSPDELVLKFSKTSEYLQALKPDFVIFSDSIPGAPDGLMRKVIEVREENGQVLVRTAFAPIHTAFHSLKFNAEKTLSPQDLPRAQREELYRNLGISDEVRAQLEAGFPFSVSISDDGGHATATINLTFTIGVDIGGDISFCWEYLIPCGIDVNEFHAKAWLAVSASAGIDVHSAGSIKKEKEISSQSFPGFTVLGILNIYPNFKFLAGLSGEVQSALKVSFGHNLTLQAGYQYSNDNWINLTGFDSSPQSAPALELPSGSGISGNLKLYAGAKLTINLNVAGVDLAGLYGQANAYIKTTWQLPGNPVWRVLGGREALLGLELKLCAYGFCAFNWKLAEASLLGNNEFEIASGSGPSPGSAGKTSIEIVTPSQDGVIDYSDYPCDPASCSFPAVILEAKASDPKLGDLCEYEKTLGAGNALVYWTDSIQGEIGSSCSVTVPYILTRGDHKISASIAFSDAADEVDVTVNYPSPAQVVIVKPLPNATAIVNKAIHLKGYADYGASHPYLQSLECKPLMWTVKIVAIEFAQSGLCDYPVTFTSAGARTIRLAVSGQLFTEVPINVIEALEGFEPSFLVTLSSPESGSRYLYKTDVISLAGLFQDRQARRPISLNWYYIWNVSVGEATRETKQKIDGATGRTYDWSLSTLCANPPKDLQGRSLLPGKVRIRYEVVLPSSGLTRSATEAESDDAEVYIGCFDRLSTPRRGAR